MPETYPDDATLLALTEDAPTGVAYIPTGVSPYYLQFRRMLYRLLRAGERANDLRVYPDGELTLGVRPGRATLGRQTLDFPGREGLALGPNVTRQVYLGDEGQIHLADAWPDDPTTYLALARVTTESGAIVELNDRRGETMLQRPGPATLGLTATAEQINRALTGASDQVTAAALEAVCGGPGTSGDNFHRHGYFGYDDAGPVGLTLANTADGPEANVGLSLSMLGRFGDDAVIERDPATGFIRQRRGQAAYLMLGAATATRSFPGTLTASLSDQLIGPAPVAGTIQAVVLSVGQNLQSDQPADRLTARVKASGLAVASTDPALTAAAGPGFRCTDQGEGTAAVLKTDASAQVQRGDLLRVDLTRAASGTVSVEAGEVAITVVIRAAAPA